MSFEELWNTPQPEPAEGIDPAIFASMQPRRVPFQVDSLSDARMVEAYKKAHSLDTSEAGCDLEVVRSKSICRKCLMHVKVCRTFGNNLKNYEAKQYKAKKEPSTEVEQEKKQTK